MDLSSNAVAYALRQLAIRAGIAEFDLSESGYRLLDLPVYYGHLPDDTVQRPYICIRRCPSHAWAELLEMPLGKLQWLHARNAMPDERPLPVGDSIPALFWEDEFDRETPRFADSRPDGSIIVHVDIIAATIFMLSRWEETVSEVRDGHNRFPAGGSIACKLNFLQRPIIDEYGLVLSAWLQHVYPDWEPTFPDFKIKLTHDIDYTRRSVNVLQLIKAFGEDLVRQKSLSQSMATAVGYIFPEKDIYLQGIYSLASISKSVGLPSAFYFMASSATEYDSGYDCASPLLKKCYADLLSMGFSVGFHPSYYTLNNIQLLLAEKETLAAATGLQMTEGRHHYLRFQAPQTWRQWEQVGLKHDLSLGYADEEGFRCGTCHTFQVFDLEMDRLLDLYETPLIVMDATLNLYRNFTPQAGQERILELAEVCRKVNGTFCLLWHNYALSGYWKDWAGAYQNTLRRLSLMV